MFLARQRGVCWLWAGVGFAFVFRFRRPNWIELGQNWVGSAYVPATTQQTCGSTATLYHLTAYYGLGHVVYYASKESRWAFSVPIGADMCWLNQEDDQDELSAATSLSEEAKQNLVGRTVVEVSGSRLRYSTLKPTSNPPPVALQSHQFTHPDMLWRPICSLTSTRSENLGDLHGEVKTD